MPLLPKMTFTFLNKHAPKRHAIKRKREEHLFILNLQAK